MAFNSFIFPIQISMEWFLFMAFWSTLCRFIAVVLPGWAVGLQLGQGRAESLLRWLQEIMLRSEWRRQKINLEDHGRYERTHVWTFIRNKGKLYASMFLLGFVNGFISRIATCIPGGLKGWNLGWVLAGAAIPRIQSAYRQIKEIVLSIAEAEGPLGNHEMV